MKEPRRNDVGLPPRPFLYTPEQLQALLSLDRTRLYAHLHFEGRTVGVMSLDKMRAVNVAPPDEKPLWRISEQELIRWMRRKGFRYYERGWIA